MDTTILKDIPFSVDPATLGARLHVEPGSADEADLARLCGEAQAIARPKALYRLAYIETKEEDAVVIDGVRFASRVLRVNLEAAHRVFAYTATCGVELDAWACALQDVLHLFWAEAIKEAALGAAVKALNADISGRYQPGNTSAMAPGSLVDWPLTQQRPLFELLGNAEQAVGVHLTASCLMVPNKSISGLRFPTETSFESCQLCPRPDCPNRRARYDAGLYDRKYKAGEHQSG